METQFRQIHEWIVAGKFLLAKRGLLECTKAKMKSAEQAIELASLYRRVDWNARGIKILAPFVIGRGRLLPQSNAEAKMEYADCLKNLGLLHEARKILKTPELQGVSRAKLILGLSYLHDYELEDAEKILFDLHRRPSPEFSHYQQQIIAVNLLMAMLHDVHEQGRQLEFRKILQRTENECAREKYQLLSGHLSVIHLQFKVLSETLTGNDLEMHLSLEDLPEFTQKTWELYFNLAQFLLAKINLREFEAAISTLRKECVSKRLHEVVREVDFHSARVTHQKPRLQTVFHQTSFPSYRQKILANDPSLHAEDPHRVVLNSSSSQRKDSIELNLADLSNEPLLVRAFMAMCEEQYMPLSPHFLWNALMPEQHYREPSSRQSIHQLVKRLRQVLAAKKIPLQIAFDQTGYRLVAPEKDVRVHWPASWQSVPLQNQSLNYLNFLERLRKHLKTGASFQLAEVMKAFPKTSRRTIQFFLVKAVNEKKLQKVGKNKGAHYEWALMQKSKALGRLIKSVDQ